jgi:hypothetical protein
MNKIHIWNCTKDFPNKVNFVDTNNVVLGYDLENQCCEMPSWSISSDKNGNNPICVGSSSIQQETELLGYSFDPNFFEQYNGEDKEYGEYTACLFKLVHEGICQDLYIRLVNCHNGYYSHGFFFNTGEVVTQGNI